MGVDGQPNLALSLGGLFLFTEMRAIPPGMKIYSTVDGGQGDVSGMFACCSFLKNAFSVGSLQTDRIQMKMKTREALRVSLSGMRVAASGCATRRANRAKQRPELAENVFNYSRKSVKNGEPSQLFGSLYLWRFVVLH